MHSTIIVAHPEREALTQKIARTIAAGITAGSPGASVELVDLAAGGFDPRYTAADNAVHLRQAPVPADVAAEQARLQRSDALVLVYPVYWWSMPALLKGWIDRVFTSGWAYDDRAEAVIRKKLGWLSVHLVAIGGADQGTYARHGYESAMKTQIDHGIFGYCGAPVVTSRLLLLSDPGAPEALLERARQIGRAVFPSSTPEEGTA